MDITLNSYISLKAPRTKDEFLTEQTNDDRCNDIKKIN